MTEQAANNRLPVKVGSVASGLSALCGLRIRVLLFAGCCHHCLNHHLWHRSQAPSHCSTEWLPAPDLGS